MSTTFIFILSCAIQCPVTSLAERVLLSTSVSTVNLGSHLYMCFYSAEDIWITQKII